MKKYYANKNMFMEDQYIFRYLFEGLFPRVALQ